MKNIAVKNGFSVMTEDELYEVNGGKQIPATSFPEMGKDGYTGEQYIMPDDHSDTIYTGKPTYTEGSADLEHGTHGVYDTETKTFTPDPQPTQNTSSSSGPSGPSGASGGK